MRPHPQMLEMRTLSFCVLPWTRNVEWLSKGGSSLSVSVCPSPPTPPTCRASPCSSRTHHLMVMGGSAPETATSSPVRTNVVPAARRGLEVRPGKSERSVGWGSTMTCQARDPWDYAVGRIHMRSGETRRPERMALYRSRAAGGHRRRGACASPRRKRTCGSSPTLRK